MDHQPSWSDGARSKTAIAGRLRRIRSEIFGEDGGPELADQLGIPFRTWFNSATGMMIPGEVLLRFLEITGAAPNWLRTGRGDRYLEGRGHRSGVPRGRPRRAGGP
jgi:hypothetical protein